MVKVNAGVYTKPPANGSFTEFKHARRIDKKKGYDVLKSCGSQRS